MTVSSAAEPVETDPSFHGVDPTSMRDLERYQDPFPSIHRLRRVAVWRMALVSAISTMNVDWPRTRLSLAPTRVNSRSTMPIVARAAGTNDPA